MFDRSQTIDRVDPELWAAIEAENRRQEEHIELIASENYASPAVMAAQGSQLGPTEWLEVTQDRVNTFADATDDHQWIHVNPERAANGPFGGTIAHGLLTLSLLPR